MKNPVTVSGSIVKKEILEPIEVNILENTFVSEASSPYANYYGHLPQKAKLNSLFFHTKKFYFLEEILSFSQQLEKCLLEKINIASCIVEFNNKQYPAIRVKNLPDYSQLAVLQQCLISQGIELAPILLLKGEVQVNINKLFVLQEVDTSIYLDTIEEDKGYFVPDEKMSPENFNEVISKIKNNSECKFFDAVQGKVLKDGEIIEVVRIYAEGLDLQLLQTVKSWFNKLG